MFSPKSMSNLGRLTVPLNILYSQAMQGQNVYVLEEKKTSRKRLTHFCISEDKEKVELQAILGKRLDHANVEGSKVKSFSQSQRTSYLV
jgi:hypothetical protein